MTVSSAIATATLNWTGVETQFAPGFQAANPGDVSVTFTSTVNPAAPGPPQTLTYNTHYAVTLDVANNVTVLPLLLPAPPATLTIARNSPPQQASHFQDGVPWSAAIVEAGFDLSALRDQELRRDVSANAALIATLQTQFAALSSQIQAVFNVYNAAIANLLGATTPLPTVLPTTPGTFWNNGGVLCVTPGGTSPLPTVQPTAPGVFWNNNGVVCTT